MKPLHKLTTKQILEQYPFSHRFLVTFAVTCAKTAMATVTKPLPEAVTAIALVDKWLLNGYEAVTVEELRVAADAEFAYYAYDAYDAVIHCVYAAVAVASAADVAADAYYYTNLIAFYTSDFNDGNNNPLLKDNCKQLLLQVIATELTLLERECIGL